MGNLNKRLEKKRLPVIREATPPKHSTNNMPGGYGKRFDSDSNKRYGLTHSPENKESRNPFTNLIKRMF
jgi:hypothetical protein